MYVCETKQVLDTNSLSMIVYRNTKSGFVNDVRSNSIASIIENEFAAHNISHNNDSEYRSWANSLQYLRNVVDVPQLDDECQVAIEYQIPLTSKRVDFLISGVDESGHNNVVIIELKQWETSGKTSRPDIVTAFTGGANRAVVHPSYQAYSYAKTIECFNENVQNCDISLHPCAYLHNYKESNRTNIDCELYKEAIALAPVFLERDSAKLTDYILRFVRNRSQLDLLYKIEDGRLRPAKSLQDALGSMLKGNKEFYLIDEQKDFANGRSLDMMMFFRDICKVFHLTNTEKNRLLYSNVEEDLWAIMLGVTNPLREKFNLGKE